MEELTAAKAREAMRAKREAQEEAANPDMATSLAVQQFQLPPYLLIRGLFADYQELNLQVRRGEALAVGGHDGGRGGRGGG